MSPRFHQELFDYIIDYACHDRDALESYSTVCKRWANRSRSHLFKNLRMCHPTDFGRWCQEIPPTADGPSRYVKSLYVHPGVVSLARETQPLDQYPGHFLALTRVVDLTLFGYRGDVYMDTISQCFSGFRNTLRTLSLASSSLGFKETSQIAEFFPNLESLFLWSPESPHSRSGDEQSRQASFPRLRHLDLCLSSKSPSLEDHLLSGFGEASMDLENLSIVGRVSNPRAVQKMVDSSAPSLTDLMVSPFGKSCPQRYPYTALTPTPPFRIDLDLSVCDKLQHITICDMLHSYSASCDIHDSYDKHLFERMLSTIHSPTLCTISVPVTNHIATKKGKTVILPKSDWSGVDSLLCDLLTRIRERTQDLSWTLLIRITGCLLHGEDNPCHLEESFTDFKAMGGTVVFLAHDNDD